MPFEFDSLSHGKIAFGFFNIETDMIFCDYIAQTAKEKKEPYQTSWEIYLIDHRADMGNLMGAIYGIDLRGFIGEVYKLFPFPKEREKFKQNPEGFKTRSPIEKLIQTFGKKTNIQFLINPKDDKIGIGEYLFNGTSFQELIKYIWLGGFPRWKDGIRPDYVLKMKDRIENSKNPLFNGFILV